MTADEGSRLNPHYQDLKKKNGQIKHPTAGLTIAHSIRTLEEFIGFQGR